MKHLNHTPAAQGQQHKRLLSRLILALFFLMPALGWGQTDYSGTWYINNQRLPDDGYYFVPTINCFYNGDEDQPHLTTFKTNQDKNSIWRIVSVTVGTETYYRIIHNATGKYLMANSAVPELAATSNAHRKRVHLETLTPQDIVNLNSDPSTDKSLFVLVVMDSGNNIVAIKSKNVGSSTTGDGTAHVFLNPRGNSSGDFDYYRAKEGRDITHTTGIVGFYGNDSNNSPSGQAGSRWKLETATSTCANPVVRYTDANTIEISYPINDDTGWTIQYTTDGSDPNTGTSITSTTTISAENVTKVRAIATKTGWDSSEESVLIASGNTQLIQSKDCEAFYMVPPIVDGDPINATTTNIPHAKMGWSFEPAGLYCGIQYYHIINVETNEYLYCNVGSGGDNALIMKSSSDITPNPNNYNEALDRAKFRLMVQNDGSYKVISKWWAAENPNAYFVNKKNGNNGTNALNLANGNSNTALWNVISVPTSPKTQFDASFASTTAHCYYIIIKSVTGDTYHVLPAATNNGNATANTSPDKQEWFFMPVDDNDPWTPYYQIRNGKTGEYLYFNGAAGANNTFYTSSYVELGYEDRYKFVVVKGANSNYPDAYNIIPKALKNQANQANNSLNRNNTTLRTQNSRNTPASLWNLVQTTFQCDQPDITFDPVQGTITMTSPNNAPIYYVKWNDGDSEPSLDTPTDGILYTSSFDVHYTHYKALAARCIDGSDKSNVVAYDIAEPFRCATPVITYNALTHEVTITCATNSATIYYTIDADILPFDPNTATQYNEPFLVTGSHVIRAVAIRDSELSTLSDVALYDEIPVNISYSSEIGLSGNYVANLDFTVNTDEPIGTQADPFQGKFDGSFVSISSLDHPLFGYVENATIKNVILDNVTINGSDNVGAICNEATGNTRIYNCGVLATGSTVRKDADGYDEITSCSSTIGGTGCVGGIVGLLNGTSRVINCFSYANITAGSYRGGIVGKNNVAYDASSYKTMVMNCMFYGDITITGSPTQIAPIYGGEIITNDGDYSGVNNFNYFRIEANYVQNTAVTKTYNCALGAETRFLQRFEFFRHLLNSNRELAAWWATGNVANKNEMMKWVMEPTQISTTTPYPILKTPGKYPSVVNYTPSETAYDEAHRNQGLKLTSEGDGGVLHVTLSMETQGRDQFGAPEGAGLKPGVTGNFDLTITDKDTEHFNFNYGKVQLPYYNDYCDGNYTGNRVVTGWKITSITGGTAGGYTTGDDVTYTAGELTATPYNFADREHTGKDLYSTSGRIFNQGAYWDVPIGVTAITIEPYWAKAVYLSDQYWDVTYQNGTGSGTAAGSANDAMVTPVNVTTVGGDPHSDSFNGQTVYNSMSAAIGSSALAPNSSHTVYDYAVVLVGNYHQIGGIESGNKPYTVMSVDQDGDNEPDYSFMLRFNTRTPFYPVRLDFLNLIGLGMAQKTTGGSGSYNFGIMQPKYWFESTNTSLFRVTQFEYDAGRNAAPTIVQGGVIEQWVGGQTTAHANTITYFHVGGNVWFKEFHRGTHQDKTHTTKHPPVSVTGGDYDEFYLTGLYTAAVNNFEDNAECYINGGRFGTVCGAAMEGIGKADGADNTGNITWQIQNADIHEFYAGGLNADKPVTGNLHTIITGSYVDIFCGGPKFGDMSTGKTVTTTATNCTFGTFFGAGFGGNSYSRQAPRNHNNIINFPHNDNEAGNDASWNAWLARFYLRAYNETYGGISTRFNYQFLPMSSNVDNVARIFVDYVKFSLATTHNVTSTLMGCTVTGNFYGGGSLGKVEGNVTSTLDGCTVKGNVFGAGFSASLPSVEVDSVGFRTEPYYYEDLGTYRTGMKGVTTTYTWEHGDAISIDIEHHKLYTPLNLSTTNLGSVSGAVTLTLKGSTTVGTFDGSGTLTSGGNVYGGGDESAVNDPDNPANASTSVFLQGNTHVGGNVYGGGNNGPVSGNSSVIIQDPAPEP